MTQWLYHRQETGGISGAIHGDFKNLLLARSSMAVLTFESVTDPLVGNDIHIVRLVFLTEGGLFDWNFLVSGDTDGL